MGLDPATKAVTEPSWVDFHCELDDLPLWDCSIHLEQLLFFHLVEDMLSNFPLQQQQQQNP